MNGGIEVFVVIYYTELMIRSYFTKINLVGIYSLMVKIRGYKSEIHRSTLH